VKPLTFTVKVELLPLVTFGPMLPTIINDWLPVVWPCAPWDKMHIATTRMLTLQAYMAFCTRSRRLNMFTLIAFLGSSKIGIKQETGVIISISMHKGKFYSLVATQYIIKLSSAYLQLKLIFYSYM